VYETRSGEVVQIVDARAPGCTAAAHSVDAVVTAEDLDDEEPHPAPAQPHGALH
jgi:hypothetical protein